MTDAIKPRIALAEPGTEWWICYTVPRQDKAWGASPQEAYDAWAAKRQRAAELDRKWRATLDELVYKHIVAPALEPAHRATTPGSTS